MASNSTFEAENTEISKRQSFNIRRKGAEHWDLSLPLNLLSDAILTLTNANAAGVPSLTRGIHFQVSKISGNYRPQALLQWLDTKDNVHLLSIYADEIPSLADALTSLSLETDEPLDLDMSESGTINLDSLPDYLQPGQLPIPELPSDIVKSPSVGRIVAVLEGDPLPALQNGDLVVRYTEVVSGGGGGPGADYYWDFESDTADTPPVGWSTLWAGVGGWTVVSGVTGATGKCLRATATGGRAALTPDTVDEDPDRANIEFLMRHRGASSQAHTPSLIARAGGTAGAEVGYRGGYYTLTADRIFEYLDGAATALGEFTMTSRPNGQWMNTRFRINGVNLYLKTWADGASEPGGWTLTASDGTLTAPGRAGLMVLVNATQYIDWIAIATGGRTAVVP